MSDPLSEYQVGGTHYTDMDVQPWTAMRAVLTPEEWIGYLKGSCTKYAMRAGHKPDTDDKRKFDHYSTLLLVERERLRPADDE